MGAKNARLKRKCAAKISYTKEEANAAAYRLNRQSRIGEKRVAYGCFCGMFHVGRPKARKKPSMRARASGK